MGIFRVILRINGKLTDLYTDAPNAEVAVELVKVQLRREGFSNFEVFSATKIGAG